MNSGVTERATSRAPRYAAPALEKGLDILELLADQAEGLTQVEIARRLGRSASEIFRMLRCLEERGYVRCKKPEDRYHLTLRLFELAHRHSPTKRLQTAALQVMHHLAESSGQSCHLSVLNEQRILVVCEVESPNPFGFSVKLGTQLPAETTSSGLVLLAGQPTETIERLLEEMGLDNPRSSARRGLLEQLRAIRQRGYEQRPSRVFEGITDLSCPVVDYTGRSIAALTVPCLEQRQGPPRVQEVLAQLQTAAAKISEAVGGHTTPSVGVVER